jgi:hypothetical protein
VMHEWRHSRHCVKSSRPCACCARWCQTLPQLRSSIRSLCANSMQSQMSALLAVSVNGPERNTGCASNVKDTSSSTMVDDRGQLGSATISARAITSAVTQSERMSTKTNTRTHGPCELVGGGRACRRWKFLASIAVLSGTGWTQETPAVTVAPATAAGESSR